MTEEGAAMDNGARRIYRYDTTRQGSGTLGDLFFEGIGRVVQAANPTGRLTPDETAMKDLFTRRMNEGKPMPPGTYFLLSDDVMDLGGPFYVKPQELVLSAPAGIKAIPLTEHAPT